MAPQTQAPPSLTPATDTVPAAADQGLVGRCDCPLFAHVSRGGGRLPGGRVLCIACVVFDSTFFVFQRLDEIMFRGYIR